MKQKWPKIQIKTKKVRENLKKKILMKRMAQKFSENSKFEKKMARKFE